MIYHYFDADINNLIKEIANVKNSHQKEFGQEQTFRYLFFADLDGTLLYGDITDGVKESSVNGVKREGYRGLAELIIKNNLSDKYKGDEGFKIFRDSYYKLVEEDPAYSANFCAKLFNNLDEKKYFKVEEFSVRYIKENLIDYFYDSSIKLINELNKIGIELCITSASPKIFVQALHHVLPIPKERIIAVTPEDPVINYGIGKKQRMVSYVKMLETLGDKVVIVGGIGNSMKSDGPLLEEIAERNGVSILVNGKLDENKTGKNILTATFSKIIKDS